MYSFDDLIEDGSLMPVWDDITQDFVFEPTEKMAELHPRMYSIFLTEFLEGMTNLEAQGYVTSSLDPETGELYYELTDDGREYIKGL